MADRPGEEQDRIHDLEVWVAEHDKTVREICARWDEWAQSMVEWCAKQHEAIGRLKRFVGDAAAFLEEVETIDLEAPPAGPPFFPAEHVVEEDE